MKKNRFCLDTLPDRSHGLRFHREDNQDAQKTHAKVEKSCDRYTELRLTISEDTAYAELRNRLGGICELFVPENRRSYNLVLSETSCGSNIWVQDEAANEAVELIDHHGRRCRDLVPAKIILAEYDNQGTASALYSLDSPTGGLFAGNLNRYRDARLE